MNKNEVLQTFDTYVSEIYDILDQVRMCIEHEEYRLAADAMDVLSQNQARTSSRLRSVCENS